MTATADASVMAMWDALPSAGADVVRRSETAAVADPEAWRKDGTLEALAREFAELCDCPYTLIKKAANGAARRALAKCHGDIDGLRAALERKRRCEWFTRTAKDSTPYFVEGQVTIEWARMQGEHEAPQLLADCHKRSAFTLEQWRRMLPVNRRAIIAEETGRDFDEVDDDPDYCTH